MPLTPPALSAADPLETSEGSIDPFSTGTGYDRLAERILPFITVRMRRPRFLTTACVSARVCEEFAGQLAADQASSPPWQVFEWYVVESHVRQNDEFAERDSRGFAGWTKVRRAVRDKRSVSSANYLKTPSVFGFHGIYRRLATGLRLVSNDQSMDEGGFELLGIWEREQGLKGFASGAQGPGRDVLEQLRIGVRAGLEAGGTSRPSYWKGWTELPRLLAPSRMGAEERRFLYDRLTDPRIGTHRADPDALDMRRQVVEVLRSRGGVSDDMPEPEFFTQLMRDSRTSPELRARLQAINAYEDLCAPLDDALQLALHLSTVSSRRFVTLEEFAAHDVARKLPARIGKAMRRALDCPSLLAAVPEVATMCSRYESVATPGDVLEACLAHHEDSQRNKPPDGKRPWIERGRGRSFVARSQYLRKEPPTGEPRYVHDYRTASVTSFLRDLARLGR